MMSDKAMAESFGATVGDITAIRRGMRRESFSSTGWDGGYYHFRGRIGRGHGRRYERHVPVSMPVALAAE